ncbi:MAG TPA: hypothetical protein VHD84_00420, partial [Candidatus Saccharimonadales bacterium]|nr:hypothetical protein [Candidatus Saccharimonadales bacterium]
MGGISATSRTSRATKALTGQQLAALRFVRQQVSLYQHDSCHWRKLMSQVCARSSDSVMRTRSVAYALWVRRHWKAVAKRDGDQAKHLMLKRTASFLDDITRLRAELGMGPERSLDSSLGVEARFNAARRLDRRLAKRWRSSSLYADLMCIHSGMRGSVRVGSGEGGMTSVSTTDPPYYGGWQMDLAFQSRYGSEFLKRWGTADKWPPWAQLLVAARAYRSGRGFG